MRGLTELNLNRLGLNVFIAKSFRRSIVSTYVDWCFLILILMLWGSPYVCEGRLNIDTSHSPINLILHIAPPSPPSPSLFLSLTTHKKFMSWRERGMKSKSTKVTAQKKKNPPLYIAQFLFTSVNHIMIFFLSFSPPPQKKNILQRRTFPVCIKYCTYIRTVHKKQKQRKEGRRPNQPGKELV